MAPLPSDCGPAPIAGTRPVVETVSAYVRLQLPADDFDVLDFAASQTTPIVGELFDVEFDKLYAVLRKDITSSLVVDGPL